MYNPCSRWYVVVGLTPPYARYCYHSCGNSLQLPPCCIINTIKATAQTNYQRHLDDGAHGNMNVPCDMSRDSTPLFYLEPYLVFSFDQEYAAAVAGTVNARATSIIHEGMVQFCSFRKGIFLSKYYYINLNPEVQLKHWLKSCKAEKEYEMVGELYHGILGSISCAAWSSCRHEHPRKWR